MLGSNSTINQPSRPDAKLMQWPPPIVMFSIASLLALSLLGAAAQAQDPARRGRALLKEFCARCHAIGKTDKSREPGALPFRMLGRSYDLDRFPRVLEHGISSSHPAMPEFKFKRRDARAVSAYLRSIQQ